MEKKKYRITVKQPTYVKVCGHCRRAILGGEKAYSLLASESTFYCSLKCIQLRAEAMDYEITNWDESSIYEINETAETGKPGRESIMKIYQTIYVKRNEDGEIIQMGAPVEVLAETRNKAILQRSVEVAKTAKEKEEVLAVEMDYQGISG